MRLRVAILVSFLAQLASAQIVLNAQLTTLVGAWVPTDLGSVSPNILGAYTAAGVSYPDGHCVFSVTMKPGDKRPVRYEQASQMQKNADGTCQMDFNVGDPAPLPGTPGNGLPQPDTSGAGSANNGSGGITAGYRDPIDLAVTELWVGQQFAYDNTCIYSQNAWQGSWELLATGWGFLGSTYSAGLTNPCPMCPLHETGYSTCYASQTNGTFDNPLFCTELTGVPGLVTFVDVFYVTDYGFPNGTTSWTFSETASGGCSGLLTQFYTFT
jgi:hypothetical protein